MGFLEAVRTCLFRKYADFRGRASRAEYWWFFLFTVLVWMPADYFGIRVLSILLSVGLFVPRMAVAVRRLHDADHSGWWALLFLVGWIPGPGWVIRLTPTVVLLWFLVQKGTAGENRYGPDPDPRFGLGLSDSPVPTTRSPASHRD